MEEVELVNAAKPHLGAAASAGTTAAATTNTDTSKHVLFLHAPTPEVIREAALLGNALKFRETSTVYGTSHWYL